MPFCTTHFTHNDSTVDFIIQSLLFMADTFHNRSTSQALLTSFLNVTVHFGGD